MAAAAAFDMACFPLGPEVCEVAAPLTQLFGARHVCGAKFAGRIAPSKSAEHYFRSRRLLSSASVKVISESSARIAASDEAEEARAEARESGRLELELRHAGIEAE
ncbi:hypothetical protein, partial [Mesorhizobium sp.]|uniref:hypothetical protein n=1 Tax=Mesorhizobium sp. TaxID=1871066 RepID=UPI000FE6FA5C